MDNCVGTERDPRSSEKKEHLIMNSVSELPQEDNPEDPNDKSKEKGAKPKKPKPGQVHIATALDGTKLFCCPECDTSYPEKELLEQHLVDHKIEKRFICDICGAGFKRKDHEERHMSSHKQERSFVCSVCKKGFKQKESLDRHFRQHAPEKTHICEECGNGFYRKDHLREHTTTHITQRAKEQAERAQAGGAPEDVQNELGTPTVTDGTAQVTIQVGTGVQEEVMKGTEQKDPKIVSACIQALTTALHEFGVKIINPEPIIKKILAWFSDRDKGVRDEARLLVIEMYKWMGPSLKNHLQAANLESVQMTELEAEFAKVEGQKDVPTRYIRSQQQKQAKLAASAEETNGIL